MIRGMIDPRDERVHPALERRRIGVCGGSMLEDPLAESYTTVDDDLKERIRTSLVETRRNLIAPPYLSFRRSDLEDGAR